jgi:hypothetical protein
MNRQFASIFLCAIAFGCHNTGLLNKKTFFGDSLQVGEWRLDSSSNRFFSYDKLFISQDSSCYIFSGSDGGSLIYKGRKYKKDSINLDNYGNVEIGLIDSNLLHLVDRWANRENFYKRIDYGDYQSELKKSLQQDSFRHKIIGWWKLISKKMPVKLINYSGYYDQFSLNIREDGTAVFYLDNKFDSAVDYSYNVNTDGIDFNRGCIVGSDCKTSIDANGRMKLVLDERMGDTLLLEKLIDIK